MINYRRVASSGSALTTIRIRQVGERIVRFLLFRLILVVLLICVLINIDGIIFTRTHVQPRKGIFV